MSGSSPEQLDWLAIDTCAARQGVEHDGLNIPCLGGRVIGPEPAPECAKAFPGARSPGEVRHARRLAKVLAIEAEEGSAGGHLTRTTAAEGTTA